MVGILRSSLGKRGFSRSGVGKRSRRSEWRDLAFNALAGGRKLPNSERIGRRDSLRQKTVVSFSFFFFRMLCSVVANGRIGS